MKEYFIETGNWVTGVSDGLTLPCGICGKIYDCKDLDCSREEVPFNYGHCSEECKKIAWEHKIEHIKIVCNIPKCNAEFEDIDLFMNHWNKEHFAKYGKGWYCNIHFWRE